jgi:hypothetical protein
MLTKDPVGRPSAQYYQEQVLNYLTDNNRKDKEY